MRLATLLSTPERPCDRAEALGILEALCNHLAPRSAPQGNIGKLTDDEIAAGCYTTRDATLVVRALTHSGWLDAHPKHRLVIHDWHEHADELVKKFLRYHRLPFFSENLRKSRSPRISENLSPPRAGYGYGSGSSPDPEGECEGEGRARGWRRVPSTERLTPERVAIATGLGLSLPSAKLEWDKFVDFDFARPRLRVDATWRNWCREAVKRGAGPAPLLALPRGNPQLDAIEAAYHREMAELAAEGKA